MRDYELYGSLIRLLGFEARYCGLVVVLVEVPSSGGGSGSSIGSSSCGGAVASIGRPHSRYTVKRGVNHGGSAYRAAHENI